MVGGAVGCGPGVRSWPGVIGPCDAGASGGEDAGNGGALPPHDAISGVAAMTTAATTCRPGPRLMASDSSPAAGLAASEGESTPTQWWSALRAAAAVRRPVPLGHR
jgi:hypothetical protein